MLVESKINELAALIIAYNEEIFNEKKTNFKKMRKVIDTCICDIKQIPGWQSSIKKLLSHSNGFVRIEAASMLLPYNTRLAVWTLLKCCLSSGIAGFHAQLILREWKAGRLKFPEYERGRIIYK